MSAISEKRYAAAALASVSLIRGYNSITVKILIRPWNLASGLAASLMATCAGVSMCASFM